MKLSRAANWLGFGAVLAVSALFAGLSFLTNVVFATSSSISLTIVSGTEDPTINISPTVEGKFVASSNTTAKVVSNHAAGYVLTVVAAPLAFTDGGTNTTYTINPLANGTAINADTFSNESNTQYNNKWGYKPSQYFNGISVVDNTTSNTGFFFPAPINTAQTLDSTTSPTSVSGTTYDVAVGARIDDTAQMGVYTSSFTFAVVGNPTPYSITYNANAGSDTVTNMPSPNPQTGNADQSTSTVTLDNAAPERDGYTFKGWCSIATSDGTCSGTTYNPDGGGTDLSFPLNLTSGSNTYTIYAMWEEDGISLYNTVASMSKGKQTAQNLQTAITVPTSANRAQDTSNSGVYEYNSSVFGTSSDTSNDYTIYYYRGVLENNPSSYGSDGSAITYPNYIILDADGTKTTSDTCWRIIRTTGSGGVKMIYNGKWTGNTCANSTTNAQTTTIQYNASSAALNRRIVRVGYTYNKGYDSTTSSTQAGKLFSTNSNFSNNYTDSIMKTYIEGTWYDINLVDYNSILEPSAGYCNDRTVYDTSNVIQSEETSISQPYGTSTSGYTQYNFGSRTRNSTTAQSPSLTCSIYSNGSTSVNREIVDNYTTNSATVGNKQLKKPVALITTDEMSFAGSGGGYGSVNHAKSYLNSGSIFWSLSPNRRATNGGNNMYVLDTTGSLNSAGMNGTYGVRPTISLKPGTKIRSGSGTATDPWVISAPAYQRIPMQDLTVSQCQALASDSPIVVYDKRDHSEYLVRYIRNACWMTQNLRITGTISATDSNFSGANFNTAAGGDLRNNSGTYTAAQSHQADSTDISASNNQYELKQLGAWYNFCAASAGQVCSQAQTTATQDICPANWHLPSNSQQSGLASYAASFLPVYGGFYIDGTLNNATGRGEWWAATTYNTDGYQYVMMHQQGTLTSAGGYKYYGGYIRCVRDA
ncbi:MAG: InlB B-repeat-containing protein [Candidatus Saccharibacteria bacterium]|nr:InlB B-repeat-containing protein [Candidatus Saccharibacteria bacterium]